MQTIAYVLLGLSIALFGLVMGRHNGLTPRTEDVVTVLGAAAGAFGFVVLILSAATS